MSTIPNPSKSLLPWKKYVLITIESLLTFYLATFCVAVFFMHRGFNWMKSGIFLTLLYAFVIFVCVKRVINALPLAALMLIVPIAPFLALVIVLSLIPLLQFLH